MKLKYAGIVALTFIPATLAGAIHTDVGVGFRFGPVDLGFVLHDNEPSYHDTCCGNYSTCSRLINEITDELFNVTMEIPRFKGVLDDAGVSRPIRQQIAARLQDFYYHWHSYTNHCRCITPAALIEIKQAARDMARTMRTTRSWSFCYQCDDAQDYAGDLRDALDHAYNALENGVSTDHLAGDLAECARCMRNR